jgi:arylsulfatase A-like enzyme
LKLVPPSDLVRGTPAYQQWLWEVPREVTIEQDGQAITLTGAALDAWKYQRYMQDYLACVQSVDDSVGRLLDVLQEEKIDDETLVIYTSDNGFFLGEHGLYDKRFMYEETIRVPFIVRWPGAVAAGQRERALAINADFAPTFLEAAGQPVPSDMQGRSLVPLLQGRKPADWRTSFYYRYYHDPGDHHTARHLGVRTERHKLIHFWKKDQWELFDLASDPHELRNVYGQPGTEALTARLKEELTRLRRELKDDDQFAETQPPAGVDGSVQQLRAR